MGFRPMIDIDSTLIEFKGGDNKTYKKQIENIEEMLERMFIDNNCLVIYC